MRGKGELIEQRIWPPRHRVNTCKPLAIKPESFSSPPQCLLASPRVASRSQWRMLMKPSVNQLLPAANSSIILVSRIVMALNRGVVRIAHLGNRPSRVERSCLAILDAPAARLRWYAHVPTVLRCRPTDRYAMRACPGHRAIL